MGLTVRIKGYEDAYDCGYITYGNFIMRLIKEAYGDVCYEMFRRSLFSGKPFTDLDEIEWAKRQNDDLEIWIWHSDCDGKFTPKECRRIYNAIKDLEIPDFYAHNYVDMNSNTMWHSKRVSDYVYSKYPITMPYYPNSKPYKVYCEDFLYKKPDAVGAYDHRALLYMIKPDGEREEINKYFMKQDGEMVEITPQMYYKHREETFA